MSWQETIHEKLTRLRAELARVQEDLIDAETELADQMADIRAFEAEFEARVGFLAAQLADLEAEVNYYLDRIRQRRNESVLGSQYRSADEQYRRTWQQPRKSAPPPPPPQPGAEQKAQLKKLYRQLARRFHPDLAQNDADRLYRTEKMSAINDAYAARSLSELLMFAGELETKTTGRAPGPVEAGPGQTASEMVEYLEKEIRRCRHRIREIELERKNLHNRPSVEIALERKMARRHGRDLLAEIAADLEKKIARKTAERDMIKSQFDNLNRGTEKT